MTRFVPGAAALPRLSVKVAVVMALLGAAGCSSDDSSNPSTASQPIVATTAVAADATVVSTTSAATTVVTTSPSSPASDQTAYCEQVARFSGAHPESYVGSAEQLADVAALIDVAPEDVIAPLRTFAQFLRSGAITAEDPNSNVVENWPPAVQDAIKEITTYDEDSC
ncbi:MAG: hypothetical protein JWL72_1312 [Ilumatobacteraceae bacterium]|nr:hypothetical protein [Ilumatobacteraceae bacterium]